MRTEPLGPPFDFALVPRTDVATSRPVLDKAGWQCECCRGENTLRVCVSLEGENPHRVALCAECRINGGFRLVLRARNRQRRKG